MNTAATTSQAISSAEAILRQCEYDTRFSQTLMPYGWSHDRLPQGMQLNIVRGARVAKIWRSEGRQTLAVHPEVVEAVSRASSSKFSMELLRAIPYINPMVVFSEPPVIKSWRRGAQAESWAQYSNEDTMRLVGFMLWAKRSVLSPSLRQPSFPEVLQASIDEVTTTHDPTAIDLAILCYFEVYDSSGKKIDGEMASLSVPFTGIYSLKELVADQAQRFAFAGKILGLGAEGSSETSRLQWFTEVYKIVLGVILYLCSTVLDAERVPTVATKHLTKSIARKPLSLYRIGWTLGAALTKYRQSILKGTGSQMGDIRHQQDPQHRKCHFRMQWYGPRQAHACELMRGRCDCDGRHREWIFIAPYWTHRERLGIYGTNTVRRVPKHREREVS